MKDYAFIESGLLGVNGQGILYPKIIDFEDKELLNRFHIMNMLKKTKSMFKYENLPDTVLDRNLELYTQTNGFTVIFEYKGKYYISYAGLGGAPDFNYLPTIATVANPALKISLKLKIDWGYEWENEDTKNSDGDCVVIMNDSLCMGLLPVHSYYASQLVENDLSINCSLINTRLLNLLVANDDNSFESLQEVIKDLKDGKISSAVDKNWLADGIKSLPYGTGASSNALIQLLEHRQYVKGSWWNELGVQSNYNMKRETITSSENILNVDSLLPSSDDMLTMRRRGWELANKKFGLNVTVDFDSAWLKIQKEIKLKEDMQLKELEQDVKNKQSTQVDKSDKSTQVDNVKEDSENVDKKDS